MLSEQMHIALKQRDRLESHDLGSNPTYVTNVMTLDLKSNTYMTLTETPITCDFTWTKVCLMASLKPKYEKVCMLF